MNDLRQLLYETEERKGTGINWIRFFRSNNAAIKQAPLQERETFLRQFKEEIDIGFSYASQLCEVSNDFVRENINEYLDNDIYYSINPIHSTEFIDRIKDWERMYPFLTHFDQKTLQRFRNEFEWKELLEEKQFSIQFIERNLDYFLWLNKKDKKLNIWKTLSYFQNLSDEFIEKYEKKLDWELMSSGQCFRQKIMLKYMDKINWTYVLENKEVIIPFSVERELRKRELI